jgi:drug/metabolite transporter (DMT)-like permease
MAWKKDFIFALLTAIFSLTLGLSMLLYGIPFQTGYTTIGNATAINATISQTSNIVSYTYGMDKSFITNAIGTIFIIFTIYFIYLMAEFYKFGTEAE